MRSSTSFALALVVGLGACSGQETDVPPLIEQAADEWPAPNRDYRNTRAAEGSSITADNVDELSPSWAFEIPGVSAYGAAATNPIIAEGIVYFQDLESNVFALELETGDVRWQRRYEDLTVGPNGVALGDGRLFAALSDGVAALDLETGDELWTVTLTESESAGLDIQPLVYGDLVLVSTVPGNVESFYAGGDAGVIYALDVENGDIRWEFNTVDSEDLWGNRRVNSGGGAWYPPAIDEQEGTILFGIGNPAPWPGTSRFPNGSSRPGPNLYTNSVVALDRTGELRWYSQVRRHDLFDLDFQISPVLADVAIGGQRREVAIGAGKTGTVVAFDRDDGEILWQTEVGRHENDELATVPEGETVTVFPGPLGGVETPIAFADDTVYVPVVNLAGQYTSSAFVADSFDPTSGTGELVAIDATTGRIKWQQLFPSVNLGGATVVNDLVFTSTFDGMIYAFDRERGNEVWRYQAPAGINAWPAVAGDTILFPAGVAGGDNPPVLFALTIGDDEGPVETTSPSPSPSPSPTETGTEEPLPGRETETPSPDGDAATTLTITTPEDSVFDKDTLEASPNTRVRVEYLNDSELPHNIHFFRGETADSETLAQTEVESGPDNQQQTSFRTPGEGRYLYRCDVHPEQMRGFLVVS